MGRKHASRPFATEGDTYAERLEDGHWGALRVLRTITTDTPLIAVTEFRGPAIPAPNDPSLLRIQTRVWHDRPTPCLCWFQGRPPAGLRWIARIPPSAAERGMGGKDAGWGFGGRWREGLAAPVFRAWQWANDRAAFDVWMQASLAPPSPKKQPRAHRVMPEARFWSLVRLVAADREDEQVAIAPLVAALAKLPVADIHAFDERLAVTLHRLDARVYAEHIGARAFRDAQHFSVDDFLYARCEVVARGRVFYERVLGAPEEMPKDATFESLLFAAQQAYESKTGRSYDHTLATSYETFANEAGW